jgi:DNA processing protein
MKYSFWLSNVSGMTRGKIFRMLESIPSAAEIFGATEKMLWDVPGITAQDVTELLRSRNSCNPEEELAKLSEQGISFVSFEQDTYPQKLRGIFDPPYSLYYRGTLPDEHACSVAIVGARGRSVYGMELAQKLAEELAKHQISVISGMARGIDADAHNGALRAGGRTYAVLGCGADICYPRENRYLYDKIPECGGILSEYPVGTRPIARLFPSRNRIISGLSDCVVIVEAREKSGSLITADFALEQGRNVYAVPGRVTDSLSSGCNMLIRQGAGVLTGIDDFLREITDFAPENEVQLDFRKNLLEKDERMVYSLLDFCPTPVGTLLEKTSFQLMELLEILEGMEQKGVIREVYPNYYAHTI